MRVLLIEDDELVASGLAAGLRLHGFTVDHAGTAGLAEAALAGGTHFDLAVLDLGLPDEDGIALLVRWRARGVDLPVLVLTARDAVAHRVKGLQSGADDYLLKPFELDELVARLQVLLRRSAGRAVDRIDHGPVTFEPATGEVRLHGQVVELARREKALLHALLRHPRHVLTAQQLHDSLYGFGDEVESNALNVHIHHLRRKLGPGIVETVRGVGYRLGSLA
jgi:two-component system, OmpR family, response regulator QseB